MDIAAAVLTRQRLVESRVRRISGDDQRHLVVNRFDELEGKVRDTFSASCRADDKELQVRVVAFGGDAVLDIEVGHNTSARYERGHQ